MLVQRLEIPIENEEKAKKAELKRQLLEHFVEEDLILEDKLNSVVSDLQLEMKKETWARAPS